MRLHGAGLGARREITGDLLANPSAVDFVEVVAEACFADRAARREACALAELWPVVPHGVKLGLGAAEGVDDERARRLGELARELRAPCVTEHVAFVRAAGREIGHLTPLPYTRGAAAVVARNADRARRAARFDGPLLLENVAWSLRWPDDEMAEGDFYREVCEESGCDLLLDLGNLYANALNAAVSPLDLLASYPLERVRMVHVAGGVLEDDFYFDTHTHALPAEVLTLLEELVARVGRVPVILERDGDFPPFAALADEIAQVRDRCGAAAPSTAAPPADASRRPGRRRVAEPGALAASQAALAALLTGDAAGIGASRFDPVGLRRASEVLERKRVDDALPLLPRLTAASPDLAELARSCVRCTPRPRRHTAARDAMRIADRASVVLAGRAAAQARADRLVLRAHYTLDAEDSPTPRSAPFFGRAASAGRVVWVWKGPGAAAPVRVFERAGGDP